MSTINTNFAIFDGTNLNTILGLDVLSIDPYKQPKRKLSISQIARTNKRKANSAFYNDKNITVRVCIKQANRDAVERRIDDLNSILQGIGKELWVPQSGATRKYYCTLNDINVLISGGAYWEANLVFALDDMFGYDTSYTTIINTTGRTSASYADQQSFDGSADLQTPFISIYYSATNTGGASKTVIVGNSSLGQQISVARNWTAGDRLEIDCLNQTVTVNGVAVAFTGAFPRFAKGVASLTYTDNMTTRTFNILAYYYRRWV